MPVASKTLLRKGQVVPVLIIAAVVLLVIFILTTREREELSSKDKATSSVPLAEVDAFVTSCVSQALGGSLEFIPKRSGFYPVPSDIPVYGGKLPYFRKGAYSRVVTPLEISDSISTYIEDEVILCTEGFGSFLSKGVKVDSGNISAITLITPDEVSVTVNYPLAISTNRGQGKLTTFSARRPSRILAQRSIAEQVASAVNVIPAEEFERMLKAQNMRGLAVIDRQTTIYSITDPTNRVVFGFAVSSAGEKR